MARTARKPKDDDTGGVIPTKDFAGAIRTWRNDIKPAIGAVGEAAQEASTGYKHIKKNCHIQPQAAKLAFKLADTEDAKRDDFLRCLVGLLKELNIPLEPRDMVDAMQDPKPEAKQAPKPRLVTVLPAHPADDSDLLGAAGDEPAPGTGAAAIAAMNAADDFSEATDDELAQQDGRGGNATLN